MKRKKIFVLKNKEKKKNFFLLSNSFIKYKNILQWFNKTNNLKKKIRLKKIFFFFYQCSSEFFNRQYQLLFNIYIVDFIKIKQFFLKNWLHWFFLFYLHSFKVRFFFKQFFLKKNCFFNFLISFKNKNIFYGGDLNNYSQRFENNFDTISFFFYIYIYKYIKINFLKIFFFLIINFFFLENFFKKFSKISKQLFLLIF